MCGSIGIVALHRQGQPHALEANAELSKRFDNGLAQINHRGPDAQGQWTNFENRAGPRPQALSNVDIPSLLLKPIIRFHVFPMKIEDLTFEGIDLCTIQGNHPYSCQHPIPRARAPTGLND